MRYLVPIYEYWYAPFQHHGVAKRYAVVVMGLAGPAIGFLRHWSLKLNIGTARTIARQSMEALSAMHKTGFVWADVNSGNLALGLASIDRLSTEELYNIFGAPKSWLVQPKEGYEKLAKKWGPVCQYEPIDWFTNEKALEYLTPEVRITTIASGPHSLRKRIRNVGRSLQKQADQDAELQPEDDRAT